MFEDYIIAGASSGDVIVWSLAVNAPVARKEAHAGTQGHVQYIHTYMYCSVWMFVSSYVCTLRVMFKYVRT